MNNLIIVPARKGSKRIKNKNLYQILNKPLIYWTINYAKKIKKKNFDLIVSSNCNKIEKICHKEKIVFLKRPEKISKDRTSMHEVIFHALKSIKKKYKYILLLQPTSPLRKLNLINKALKILDKNKIFDSLIHLAHTKSFIGKLKNKVWKPDFALNKRSQDINDKFVPTGNLFVYKSYLYKNKIKYPKKTYGLYDSNCDWVDIDCKEDLAVLNYYLTKPKNRKMLKSKKL